MVTYFIYEVPGHKNGATNQWEKRSRQNFNKYGVMPIVIETMEGPNEPEFWQIVGDREWELADQNGYPRGEHYRAARERRPIWSDETRLTFNSERAKHARSFVKNPGCQTPESRAKLAKSKTKYSEEFKRQIKSEWIPNKKGHTKRLAEKYNLSPGTIRYLTKP